MANQEGKYNIKAVSKMLGIQPGTLRAWERRYQMVAPKRNESGHRLYTEEHVKTLRWLLSKIDQGFTISQAVSLLENNVLESDPEEPADGGNHAEILGDRLLDALLQFDESKAHDLINQAFSLYTIDKVLVDILGSLLVKIGDLWERGEITTAHEHFASSILRSRIGIILHSFPHNSILPKAVAVCGPNEWHELGLLIFTLFLRRKGFEVVYLGASIDEKDIDVVIETVNPKFLFFSCTMKENLQGTLELAEKLYSEHSGLSIGLGGFAVGRMPQEKKDKYASYILGNSKSEWEHWIKEQMS
ncbi:MerR family transcriptional regulator [Bacillus infantis]|uniref:MerR family transcriptional regulator n=1 Tax=Bacillus infantis TaxID=324767 RepID=UPI003CE99D5C